MLHEGECVYVILSNPRLMKGHVLVVPKRHVMKLSELNVRERVELLEMVTNMQEKILSRFSTGCDVRHHYRPFLKESQVKVNHLHIHVHPREFQDELYKTSQQFERFVPLEDTEREEMHRLFKEA